MIFMKTISTMIMLILYNWYIYIYIYVCTCICQTIPSKDTVFCLCHGRSWPRWWRSCTLRPCYMQKISGTWRPGGKRLSKRQKLGKFLEIPSKTWEPPGKKRFLRILRWDNSWNMRKPWTFFGVQKRNLCFTEHWAGEKLPKSIAFVQICGKAFKPMVLLGVSWRITPLKWFITRVVNCFELFIDGVTWTQGSHDKEVEWSHGHVLGFRTPSGWTTCSCQRWEFAPHLIWSVYTHSYHVYIYIYIHT